MTVKFQSESFEVGEVLENFSIKNHKSGSVVSFLGKVREYSGKNKVQSMDIEFYEKMANYQSKLALDQLLKKLKIQDFLIIHRYGNLKPGENIIFVTVASAHRKDGLEFIQKILIFFKKKITFWKKENFKEFSKWVGEQE